MDKLSRMCDICEGLGKRMSKVKGMEECQVYPRKCQKQEKEEWLIVWSHKLEPDNKDN